MPYSRVDLLRVHRHEVPESQASLYVERCAVHGDCRTQARGPSGNQVEVLARYTLQELVEPEPLIASLRATNTTILENLDDVPVVACCGGFKFDELVLNCLTVR